MALTERIELDLRDAQRQIAQLEQQLQGLSTPVAVPVNISGEGDLERIRRELGLSDDAAENLNRELAQTDEELRQAGSQAQRTGADIESAGRRGGTAFAGLRGSVVGLIGAFGAIQGARAFLDFAGDAIGAASDLEESTSKATVVFGEFFDEIEAFAQTGPQALGLANAQALEFAGTFGNLFVALGLSQQAAADLAPEIVQLGADLASFNNIEVTEALDKLRAGIVGEAEPLRVLGVNLTAAATAAKAVELGLADSTTEVSEAAKVQARYALILEQTATAQGDFARTADGIANRQRTLAAEFENFRAQAGEALLPFFEGLLEAAPAALQALEDFIPVVIDFVDSLADIDFGEAIAGLRRFGTTASAVISLIQGDPTSATAGGFVNDFVQSVEAGVEPVQAFAAVLEQFQGFDIGVSGSLDAEQVAAVVDQLADVADLDTTGILLLLRYFQEFGPAMDLTEAELAGITTGLENLLRPAGAVPPALDELVGGVSSLGAAGAETGILLSGAGTSAEAAAAAIEAAAAQTATAVGEIESALGDFDVTDSITPVVDLIGQLPTALDGAAAAMRDEEGEIEEDFSTFLSNLEDQLAEQQAFSGDIAILRDLGFDDLADSFTQGGLETAAALADAVANPEEAARAEALLDQYAVEQAESFRTSFADELEQALDLTVPLNVTALIQALNIRGLNDLFPNISEGQRLRDLSPQTPAQENNNNVTVNYYTEPGPSVETQRAVQQISELIN